jgi:molecular chaperone GrpE
MDEEGNEKSLQSKLKDIKEKLKNTEKEKKEYLDGWQRMKADSINEKKRFDDQKKDIIEFANQKLLMDFVPVMDSFLMAMKNKEAWETVDKNWRIGVEYIKGQLETAFKNQGLEVFGEIGEVADPSKYSSLETVETEDKNLEGKVAEILQSGFTLKGKVVREAKCKTYILKI